MTVLLSLENSQKNSQSTPSLKETGANVLNSVSGRNNVQHPLQELNADWSTDGVNSYTRNKDCVEVLKLRNSRTNESCVDDEKGRTQVDRSDKHREYEGSPVPVVDEIEELMSEDGVLQSFQSTHEKDSSVDAPSEFPLDSNSSRRLSEDTQKRSLSCKNSPSKKMKCADPPARSITTIEGAHRCEVLIKFTRQGAPHSSDGTFDCDGDSTDAESVSEDDPLSVSDDFSALGPCDECSAVGSIASFGSRFDLNNSRIGLKEREYKVQFSTYAYMVEIPNRHSYSDEEKFLLWNCSKALTENAVRNSIEFEYDNWNFHSVLEEDQFIERDGELIHPAHTAHSVQVLQELFDGENV